MDLIRRLFGGSKKPDLAVPPPLETRVDAKPLGIDSQAAMRRELVRVLTRDTQRFAGIPNGWIDSQVLLEPGRDGQTYLHLRLVVKHWDEWLIKYAVAFQRKLQSEIERFEPGAHEWLLSITWQYQVDSECPFLELPDAFEWGANGNQSREQDEVQEDLARFFAVRDAHLSQPPTQQPEQRPRPAQAGSDTLARKAKP